MNLIVPLINGKSYEWSDIILNIMGVPIVGITKIEYEQTQDMQNIFGAGRYPVSRGYGKMESTCKITLLMEEIENIMMVAPLGIIQDIPEFDIIVAFIDPMLVPKIHKVRNCRFKNNVRTTSQGEQSIPVDCELICSHIEYL